MSRAIVTGGTKDQADAMAVLAINLKTLNPEIADCMVIYHDGIPYEIQKKMQQIMPMRFIEYRCPVSRFKCWLNRSIRYFSPMVFCKYEAFTLLDDYDEVMWTDYDVVIKEDISELWSETEKYSTIIDHNVTLKEMFNEKFKQIDKFPYDAEAASVCTPLFVIKRGIGDPKELTRWCYNTTDEYVKYLYLPEQCIFTMMVSEFDLQPRELDKDVYFLHPREAKDCTKILHAYGQPKFWNGLNNDNWNAYFSKWQNMV